jgi:integrase
MRTRGLGRIYQPKYRDKKTGEKRTSPTWWIAYSFRGIKYRESSKSPKPPVLKHLPEVIRPVVTFAYYTGWRIRSEVLPMQWRQIDLAAGTVRLEPGTTKNEEGRLFPFAVLHQLAEVLQEQRLRTNEMQSKKERLIPWVFHRNGRPIKDFRKAWKLACEAAGIAGMIPHDFRRTAVRNLERAGVSRSAAMKLTGHKTESVYRRYAIVSESDLAEGVKKLAALGSKKGKVRAKNAQVS